jgi:sRNA-binding regulator protein Hfq
MAKKNRTNCFTILLLFLFFFFINTMKDAGAEIIYLHDGETFKGTITKETKKFVTIKTKYQTRKIHRRDIKRILYGEREMEPINIVLQNGKLVSGFLVDQDNNKVIIRSKKNSGEEFEIKKSSIEQMSHKEIFLLYPKFFLKTGLFIPLGTEQGANLNSSLFLSIGTSLRVPWSPPYFLKGRSRVSIELGYTQSRSADDDRVKFLFVPLTARYTSLLKFKHFDLMPGIGIGGAYVSFDDGEDMLTSGLLPLMSAGVNLSREFFDRRFILHLFWDYHFLFEKSNTLHSFILGLAVGYRY